MFTCQAVFDKSMMNTTHVFSSFFFERMQARICSTSTLLTHFNPNPNPTLLNLPLTNPPSH